MDHATFVKVVDCGLWAKVHELQIRHRIINRMILQGNPHQYNPKGCDLAMKLLESMTTEEANEVITGPEAKATLPETVRKTAWLFIWTRHAMAPASIRI